MIFNFCELYRNLRYYRHCKEKEKKNEDKMEGGGWTKYTKQLPCPSKNVLVWEFTKLGIRTYERGKAPCFKIHVCIFCLGEAPVRSPKTLQLSELLGGAKRGPCSVMDPLTLPPGEDPGIDVGGGAVLERGLIQVLMTAKKCHKDIISELFPPDRPS